MESKLPRKLGFKGFPALKLAPSEAGWRAARIRTPSRCITPFAVTIRCVWLSARNSLKTMFPPCMPQSWTSTLEETPLEAVTLLRNARRVIVTGIGASGLVARVTLAGS